MTSMYQRFLDLHARDELFIMPNPWDVGSAKILASLGFAALATTSSGHAATLGRHDQHVSREELVDHVADMTAAADVPFNVDSERLFAATVAGIGETIALLARAGAAGCSIEDYDPATGTIDPIDLATERVAAAATACRGRMVLTARAENFLYGVADLGDTIERLTSFAAAGADCVYAPGLTDLEDIATVVLEVGVPLNVLVMPGGPTIDQLADVGVRRVSTGGALAWAAYGAMAAGARELLEQGTSRFTRGALSADDRRAFDG